MEKAIVSMVKAENQDIKNKHDAARLLIDQCQLSLINVHSSSSLLQSEIKDAPNSQVSLTLTYYTPVLFSEHGI